MNDLQKIELDILKVFVSICDKLNLRYYLVCGSALGAVKYGGFIPWDDDIDVALPRRDYEKFLENAKEFLPEYYFLQNSETDPEFPLIFSKLRDSRTTCIEKGMKEKKMNHGVYIDIFPLDGYPSDDKEIFLFERQKRKYERRRKVALEYNRFQYPWAVMTNLVYIFNLIFGVFSNTQYTIKKYNKLLSSYDENTSDIWCNHGNWQGKLEYAQKEQYGEGRNIMFEDVCVKIPYNYNEYLTQKYGDWEKELPITKQCSHHEYHILDLYNSYTFYLK